MITLLLYIPTWSAWSNTGGAADMRLWEFLVWFYSFVSIAHERWYSQNKHGHSPKAIRENTTRDAIPHIIGDAQKPRQGPRKGLFLRHLRLWVPAVGVMRGIWEQASTGLRKVRYNSSHEAGSRKGDLPWPPTGYHWCMLGINDKMLATEICLDCAWLKSRDGASFPLQSVRLGVRKQSYPLTMILMQIRSGASEHATS